METVSDLLTAIDNAEIYWDDGIITVTLYADGSGGVGATGRTEAGFESIKECAEILESAQWWE